MINYEGFGLVNHELWMEEHGGKVYLMWGHYPKTDGRIDPRCITMIVTDDMSPAYLGVDKRGMFVETNGNSIGVVYDRGVYVRVGESWYFGEVPYRGEAVRVIGFSTYHRKEVRRVGLELELTLSGDRVLAFYRGKEVDGVVKVSNGNGTGEVRVGNRVELAEGINVLTFRITEHLFPVKRCLVATLTVRR